MVDVSLSVSQMIVLTKYVDVKDCGGGLGNESNSTRSRLLLSRLVLRLTR